MSLNEHVGPSSRIGDPGSEQPTTLTENTTPETAPPVSARDSKRNSPSGFEKVQTSSRNIQKKRSPKQRVPRAVIQAAKTARNPAQDFRNRKQEIGKQEIHIRQKAQKFLSRGQRWRRSPASRAAPPRDPDRANHLIQYQKKGGDPVIVTQQVQRRQNFQDQTIHALANAVRAIQQHLHLGQSGSNIPEGNHPTTTENQTVSVENIPLPNTVFPGQSNNAPVTQLPQGESNIGLAKSRAESPILEAKTVDFESLEREVKRRRSTSSSSSSSSSESSSSSSSSSSCDQDVLNLATDPLEVNSDSNRNVQITKAKTPPPDKFAWAHNLSDSSPEKEPYSHAAANITESQIAIRTSTRPDIPVDYDLGQHEIDKLQELAHVIGSYAAHKGHEQFTHHPPWAANHEQFAQDPPWATRFTNHEPFAQHPPWATRYTNHEQFAPISPWSAQNQTQYPWQYSRYPPQVLQALATPPPPPPAASTVISPVISINIDSGRSKHRKTDLTPEEQTKFNAEVADKKKGARKRLKKRIIQERTKK